MFIEGTLSSCPARTGSYCIAPRKASKEQIIVPSPKNCPFTLRFCSRTKRVCTTIAPQMFLCGHVCLSRSLASSASPILPWRVGLPTHKASACVCRTKCNMTVSMHCVSKRLALSLDGMDRHHRFGSRACGVIAWIQSRRGWNTSG
jgi:hypothetical protein